MAPHARQINPSGPDMRGWYATTGHRTGRLHDAPGKMAGDGDRPAPARWPQPTLGSPAWTTASAEHRQFTAPVAGIHPRLISMWCRSIVAAF